MLLLDLEPLAPDTLFVRWIDTRAGAAQAFRSSGMVGFLKKCFIQIQSEERRKATIRLGIRFAGFRQRSQVRDGVAVEH
jgi:hypothetical protein